MSVVPAAVCPIMLGATLFGLVTGISPARAQTRAGTAIENVAHADYRIGDAPPATTASNTDRLIVAERLDLTLAAGAAPSMSGNVVAWPVTVRNTGNGPESFALEPTAPAGTTAQLALDIDGDGRFDPVHDRLLDAATPTLAPGEAAPLLVLVTLPAAGLAADAAATLVARATTGAGTPGTSFAGRGEGGGDAVVGATGASAQVSLPLAAAAAPQLAKSQSVAAPDGSARAISGATITYTLAASFAGPVPAARIEDAVPAGTHLVPGSLQLDGAALSDAADADAGSASPAGIAVALGDIPGPATRRVQFKVQVQ